MTIKNNILSLFKNFYKPKVIKIHCYWYKDGQIDQWDRTESRNKPTNICSTDFDKGTVA